MALRFLDKKTHRFYFVDAKGKRQSYVLIFGDELDTVTGAAARGPSHRQVRYRKKILPRIINVRSNGETLYAFRRVQQSYQWESYGPIDPID